MQATITRHSQSLFSRYPSLQILQDSFARAGGLLHSSVSKGGKILVCGNGGSAADAEHIVGELMKGFLLPRPLHSNLLDAIKSSFPADAAKLSRLQETIPAISLASGVSLPTAFANDVDSELCFAQQVLGLAKPGDVVWGISTSGNSANVNLALKMAKVLGCSTLGLSGKDGGAMAELLDVELRVPAHSTPHVQELHLPVYHALCACLEDLIFA